jgi:hypothetical protein
MTILLGWARQTKSRRDAGIRRSPRDAGGPREPTVNTVKYGGVDRNYGDARNSRRHSPNLKNPAGVAWLTMSKTKP